MAKQFKHHWHIFVDHLPKSEVNQFEFASLLLEFLKTNMHFFDEKLLSLYGATKYIEIVDVEKYPVTELNTIDEMKDLMSMFVDHKLERPEKVLRFILYVLNRIFIQEVDVLCIGCNYPSTKLYLNKLNGCLCNVCPIGGTIFYLDGTLVNEDQCELAVPTLLDHKNSNNKVKNFNR